MAVAASIVSALVGSSGVAGSSVTTGSYAFQAGRLYIADFATRTGSGVDPTEPTLTGTGLTWVRDTNATVVYDNSSSSRRRLTRFRCLPSSNTTTTLTLDEAGQSQTTFQWKVTEFTGIDTGGTNGSVACRQTVNGSDPSATTSSLLATLAAFGSADNATYATGVSGSADTFSAGSGFTELSDTTSSDSNISMMSEFRADNDTTADMSLSSVSEWGIIATEIVAAAVSVTVTPTEVAASFSIIAPTVVLSGDVTVAADTVSLTASVIPPTVSATGAVVITGATLKTFVYKVYTKEGAYITTWSDDVTSLPRFTTAINSGPGELVVRLARDFEAFGEDDDVTFANRVDVYVFDNEQPNGLLLYRGFISQYAPILDEGKEYIQVTLLPYISVAAKIMLREASGATEVPFLSQDPSDIARGIVTRAVADGLDIDTTASSIETTGTVVSYTFNTNTVKEAFDKVIELAPMGWYWRVDPDGTYVFAEKPDTSTHNLFIGEHIETMQPEKRIESITNRVYITGGGDPPLYRVYSRSSSIAAYGLRAVKVIDQRVTNTSTAQTIATRLLDEGESPEVRTRLVIVDNNGTLLKQGYDIESIKVGDTVSIKNLQFGQKSESLWDVAEWDVDVWDQTLASIAATPLLVVKTTYNQGNTIEIETSSRFPVVSKRIEDINRNVQNSQTVNNPTTPS